jgi:hypothetical protein
LTEPTHASQKSDDTRNRKLVPSGIVLTLERIRRLLSMKKEVLDEFQGHHTN